MPTNWGHYTDDGQHGFIVTVSDTPCTDAEGCPMAGNGKGKGTATLCDFRLHHTSAGPATVDCKGAKGAYVQISLPGNGNRLFAATAVVIHEATSPSDGNTASTNPALQTVCYGVAPR